MNMKSLQILFLLLGLFMGTGVYLAASDKGVEKKPAVKTTKAISKTEACRKYDKKHIVYYSDIYFVEKCQRHLVVQESAEFKIVKSGTLIEVDQDVVQAIPRGEPMKSGVDKKRSCKELEGRYVTTHFIDIYYVDGCKKRLFPEWDTYQAHSQTKPRERREILEVTDAELSSFKDGKDMPNLERQDDEVIVDGSTIDLLPIKEACKGLEGKIVAFYGAIYRIEKCRKRPIVSQSEVDLSIKSQAVIEINATQWYSLPKGKPIGEKPASATEEESVGSDFIEEESL